MKKEDCEICNPQSYTTRICDTCAADPANADWVRAESGRELSPEAPASARASLEALQERHPYTHPLSAEVWEAWLDPPDRYATWRRRARDARGRFRGWRKEPWWSSVRAFAKYARERWGISRGTVRRILFLP